MVISDINAVTTLLVQVDGEEFMVHLCKSNGSVIFPDNFKLDRVEFKEKLLNYINDRTIAVQIPVLPKVNI